MKNLQKHEFDELMLWYQVNLNDSDVNDVEYNQQINGYSVGPKPQIPLKVPGEREKYLNDPSNYNPCYSPEYSSFLQQAKKLENIRLLPNSRIKICHRYKMYDYYVTFGWASDLNAFQQIKQGIDNGSILRNRFKYRPRINAGYNRNKVKCIY